MPEKESSERRHLVAEAPRSEASLDGGILDLWPPTLLDGESRDAYHHLLSKVSAAVTPADVIEQFWVRDVVDLMWEVLRLRTLKAELLRASNHKGLAVILAPVVGQQAAVGLAGKWYKRDKPTEQIVDGVLNQIGLDMRAVMAQTLSKNLDDVERIDRMLANAEARRNAVLREIDRHRAAVADRLRHAAREIEDAEFPKLHPQSRALQQRDE